VEADRKIKNHINFKLGFTVNIIGSHNKLLAKIASELKKSDMVHNVWEDEIPAKMWSLPVEELFGVGRATGPKLQGRGIYTTGELAKADRGMLGLWLKSFGLLFHDYTNGIETTPVRGDGWLPIKVIGNSTTLPFDVDNTREAHLHL
jgi:DNA polymerase-4